MSKTDRNVSDFFDVVDPAVTGAKSIRAAVHDLSPVQLVDFTCAVADAVPTNIESAKSPFDFIANSTLSGAPFPCVSLDCRLKKIDDLARYAALYADRVVIRNPFDGFRDHLLSICRLPKKSFPAAIDELRQSLAEDLEVLYRARPLLEAGIFQIAKTPNHFCAGCFERVTGESAEGFKARTESLAKSCAAKLLSDLEVKIELRKKYQVVSVSGPDAIGTHEISSYYLKPLPFHRRGMKVGKVYKLRKKEVLEFRILDRWVDQLVDDLVARNLYSAAAGSQYLTDRPIDLIMAAGGEGGERAAEVESLNLALGHTLPYLNNVSVDRLLALRAAEPESFAVYRDALQGVLSAAQGKSRTEIKRMMRDSVQPEIHKIEQVVKRSKRLLWDGIVSDVVIGAGFVTAGLWSGVLTKDAAAVLAAIGGFKTVTGVIASGRKLLKEPDDASKEKFHFLWRVKQEAGSH